MLRSLAVLLAGGLLATPVFAQEQIIYPAKGQSAEQTEKDKFECYTWARQQSGFDPMAPPTATQAPPKQGATEGGVGGGAVRGALVGTAVGAIAGNTGRGAAIGAASGGLIGGMRRSDQRQRQKQAEQQWANDQAAQYTNRRNAYNRAHAACLEGRGYTVR